MIVRLGQGTRHVKVMGLIGCVITDFGTRLFIHPRFYCRVRAQGRLPPSLDFFQQVLQGFGGFYRMA